ncbi:NAD-dependent epimerase/dehydratase family protein [Methylobacterium sp. Leaf118]|uniref:NAD-dependent epimerase/dehydratase family protein n=1 Tax=Methylobacterium sp. Leaf118 TaxID=2876562 RepID=UPI001E3427E2|nr:NAD-dependent epimerase/dehydratase family protein [Methylobacterium sp. Leaf118]
MTRVLVLGAGGFVGRHLVAALAADSDFEPMALMRGAANALPPGVPLRRADATDSEALRQALAGIDAVVNCIAGTEAAMTAVTRHLVALTESGRVQRLVHLSSMAVYGPVSGTVGETSPLDGSDGPYARAKVDCEAMIAASATVAARSVVLRPGCIHGPGSPQWTERIGRLLRRHRIGDLGENGDGTCNLTFIDDMVQAILAALRRPEVGGGIVNVSDPNPRSWNAYLTELGRAIGAVPVARISGRRLSAEVRLLAPALVVAGRVLDRSPVRVKLPPAVTPSMARLWRQEITLDHRRADAVLAFRRTPPARAIAAAADWLRTSG